MRPTPLFSKVNTQDNEKKTSEPSTHSVRIAKPTTKTGLYRLRKVMEKPATMPKKVSATVWACMK